MKTSNLFLLTVVATFAVGSAMARGPGNAAGGSAGASAGNSAGKSAGASAGSMGSAGQSRAGNPGVGTATQTRHWLDDTRRRITVDGLTCSAGPVLPCAFQKNPGNRS